jgi:hypothetical protein
MVLYGARAAAHYEGAGRGEGELRGSVGDPLSAEPSLF